jgi:hypothetical protein
MGIMLDSSCDLPDTHVYAGIAVVREMALDSSTLSKREILNRPACLRTYACP